MESKKLRNILCLLIIVFGIIVVIKNSGDDDSDCQSQTEQAFHGNYRLKEVVVLSRHNIRSPLSTNGSALGRITNHDWFDWTSASSELSLRGGVLETIMGQYFRKWLVSEGLFVENYQPKNNEVYIYANSMQRTIATAQYFASGFMPVADLKVFHKLQPSQMDPVFNPQLTKVSDSFEEKALEQIAAMGGSRELTGIGESLQESYEIISEILDMQGSPACLQGDTCGFKTDDTQISFVLNKEPSMKGSLKLANLASDALILQYYEEPDTLKAAFGHDVNRKNWEKVAQIKDVYGDMLFAAPIVAANVAHPLLKEILKELRRTDRKFTFLCGHDSNVASVNAALEMEDYDLPQSIEKKTPIGCKLIFEKWENKEGQFFVKINMMYQSTDQLREIIRLDLKTPPMIIPLHLKGLTANADGLYRFEDVENRFKEAISAYDDIR